MKQVAQNYKSGELTVLDVPAPACRPGGVLVRTLFSLISTGTEMMKVTEAKLSLVGKARARPDQVAQGARLGRPAGCRSATYKKVMNRLDSYTPLGYSLCGVVIEVGARRRGVPRRPARRRGGQRARAARRVQLGADQPVRARARRGRPRARGVRHRRRDRDARACAGPRSQLGETACVIGLGLVGQLVVRLLVAAGVRVVGVDIVEDRCRLAEKAGALLCAAPTGDGRRPRASSALAAASPAASAPTTSSSPPAARPTARSRWRPRLARDRARSSTSARCRLDLPWNAYYEKELDVRFSRSYGPGRYDDRYELDGIDYPAGYVRWTERRNLGCFLDLIAREHDRRRAAASPACSRSSDADEGLRRTSPTGTLPGIGFLLRVPGTTDARAAHPATRRQPAPRPPARPAPRPAAAARCASASSAPATTPRRCCCRTCAGSTTCGWPHVATTRSLSAAERAAQVRLRQPPRTDADAVLDDDVARRGLHRHPPQLARRARLPGAASAARPCSSRSRSR